MWSFEAQRCVATFAEHKQAVWSVRWHDQGEWLASSSLDHTVRLWDVGASRCRQVLRGHVDSVNDVNWQPGSSAVATGVWLHVHSMYAQHVPAHMQHLCALQHGCLMGRGSKPIDYLWQLQVFPRGAATGADPSCCTPLCITPAAPRLPPQTLMGW